MKWRTLNSVLKACATMTVKNHFDAPLGVGMSVLRTFHRHVLWHGIPHKGRGLPSRRAVPS